VPIKIRQHSTTIIPQRQIPCK